jgi:hypothetical protein
MLHKRTIVNVSVRLFSAVHHRSGSSSTREIKAPTYRRGKMQVDLLTGTNVTSCQFPIVRGNWGAVDYVAVYLKNRMIGMTNASAFVGKPYVVKKGSVPLSHDLVQRALADRFIPAYELHQRS